MFLWTHSSSLKQIKAPYVFDWVHGIGLYTMKGNQASSHGEWEVSWFFSSCSGNLGYILELWRDGHSKLVFVQRCHDSCLVTRDTSGISSRLGRATRSPLEVRRETQRPFLVATVILGFLSIFNKSQPSSPFEALNSACLSKFQRVFWPPIQTRKGPRAFSMVSTGDSHIVSCCEVKDEPAFKPLKVYLAFF